jgi:hypothetical protein
MAEKDSLENQLQALDISLKETEERTASDRQRVADGQVRARCLSLVCFLLAVRSSSHSHHICLLVFIHCCAGHER